MKSVYKFLLRHKITLLLLILSMGAMTSCKKHLEKLNVNPNGADPATTNPNLVLSTVLTTAGQQIVTLGFGDATGIMQYTQVDGWTGNHNEYDWSGDNPWTPYYDILRNNKYVYDRSVDLKFELQQGISLTMKSMIFGLITDLWGDAPYSHALLSGEGGLENTYPVFDAQKDIYTGILADLEKANTLLSKPKSAYTSPADAVDVYFKGDPAKWRKLANSLALRFYMRLSEKLPDVAKAGIEKIVADPTTYPIMNTVSDDALMDFAGNSSADSWPTNVNYNSDSGTYRVNKMAATFINALKPLNDPRLGVWANKVQIFLHVDPNFPTGTDKIRDTVVNGENRKVRYLSPDILAGKGLTEADIDQDPDYVGIPTAIVGGQVYNMGPDANQGAHNPHVSWLNSTYMGAKGGLLKARIMSAAEVHFILAEAALKGWAAGDAQMHYNMAIQQSLTAWGVGGSYGAYIAQPQVAWDGTLERLITQKWISFWTVGEESWFDYRRTGYPALTTGPASKGPVLPVRFYYMLDERNLNPVNTLAAEGNLEVTTNSGYGADATNGFKNSAWSKPWIIQGTGKPW
ncbi:SusD/RagB family nutrient-binding outer membrane lipoprotein [Flavitalea flava]